MPTIITHAAVPLALGLGLGSKIVPRSLLIAGVVAAMLPDLDVIGLRLGVAYGDELGHRGFSHSLVFTACVALLGALALRRSAVHGAWRFTFLWLAGASHGALDMLTTGGHGIALLWPFSDARFFAPWHLIRVSPLTLDRFYSNRGMQVVLSELRWVWAPAAGVWLALRVGRSVLGRTK